MNPVLVTVFADHFDVGSFECEVCKIMIKGFHVQVNDFGIPPLMFGVATCAFGVLGRCKSSMNAGTSLLVLKYVLVCMTAQAQVALQGLGECGMTFGTFALNISMGRNNRSGHHQFFNACRSCCMWEPDKRQYNSNKR